MKWPEKGIKLLTHEICTKKVVGTFNVNKWDSMHALLQATLKPVLCWIMD